MNIKRYLLSLLMAVALPGTVGGSTTLAATSDSVYIGDASDNTIKRFDAQTGAYLGILVPTAAGLLPARGILHVDANLIVANQNANQPFPGEIDRFNIANGASLGALVPRTSSHAPFAPRGIVVGPSGALFVADFGKGQSWLGSSNMMSRQGRF